MQTLSNKLIAFSPMALVAGAMIGYAFGAVQVAAAAAYERLQQEGKFKSGMGRHAGLVSAHSLPPRRARGRAVPVPDVFYHGRRQPVVRAVGVVLGYGWTLYRQMRLRTA
jgi:hypothetical protein